MDRNRFYEVKSVIELLLSASRTKEYKIAERKQNFIHKKCYSLKNLNAQCSQPPTNQFLILLFSPNLHSLRKIVKESEKVVKQNRLLLKTFIRAVWWLALQGCAFRGHDESYSSHNRGNFLELVNFQAELCKEIGDIVLSKAAKNAKYIAPSIQQEILKIIADLVRSKIRDEIEDAKFCILVDEATDESHKTQMALVLRYVDVDGVVRERFMEVVVVDDTNSITLKTQICNILSHHKLLVENMRGQGYDGASNMRGEWNGLQALFLRDCPYAYYVYCFAHRLQLALVAAAKEVSDVWLFFSKLTSIVNFVTISSKRHCQLQSIREDEIVDLIVGLIKFVLYNVLDLLVGVHITPLLAELLNCFIQFVHFLKIL
ncbi:uncharacterized protein [Henckelia pumila]|uniref:uncharacterized protein n=1 Tax=Henckelia pumila TaxID=405737 RepID=UPI003C6E8C11